MKNSILILATIAGLTILSSCNRKGCTDEKATNYNEKAKKDDGSCILPETIIPLLSDDYKESALNNYSNIVLANYEDALEAAVKMQSDVKAFVSNPSSATLSTAKSSWLSAREPYGQTEAFRFSNGPIDDADGPEGLLNAWPLDENYIDYVQDGSSFKYEGVIYDTINYSTINATTLEGLNEKGGEKNISIGYHAIEFLLWGQDLSTTGAGERSHDDFDITKYGKIATRRGQYINICADLIVKQLTELTAEWKSGGSYLTALESKDVDLALKEILTGIGVLSKSELAGERMFSALKAQDQEEEHSCFSDNTHRDIITNAMGIQNVYMGKYTRTNGSEVSGTSIYDLVKIMNESLANETSTLISSSVSNSENIPVPFDNAISSEIVGGSGPVMVAIKSLQDTGDKIAESASSIGITISTDLPD